MLQAVLGSDEDKRVVLTTRSGMFCLEIVPCGHSMRTSQGQMRVYWVQQLVDTLDSHMRGLIREG